MATEHAEADDISRAFQGAAGQFVSSVTVIIAMHHGEPYATTASTVVPVSVCPPLIAVFLAIGSRMQDLLLAGARFSISVLAEHDHMLARRFGRSGRPSGWAALEGVEMIAHDGTPPVLARSVAWMDCVVHHALPTGDHSCVIGSVLAVDRTPEAEPLAYYRGRFHRLGESVAPAPWRVPDANDLVADW